MKRLYRSRDNKMIAGVSGGLAEYFEIDPVIMRILFVCLALFGGSGILAYILAWIIIPDSPLEVKTSDHLIEISEGPEDQDPAIISGSGNQEKTYDRTASILGFLLIGFGVILLLNQLFPYQLSRFIWPSVLIALGVFIFTREKGGQQ